MSYPIPANEIVEVLTELCRHEKLSEQVELLANSNAQREEVVYDKWNGGTTSWALRLAIPLAQFEPYECVAATGCCTQPDVVWRKRKRAGNSWN